MGFTIYCCQTARAFTRTEISGNNFHTVVQLITAFTILPHQFGTIQVSSDTFLVQPPDTEHTSQTVIKMEEDHVNFTDDITTPSGRHCAPDVMLMTCGVYLYLTLRFRCFKRFTFDVTSQQQHSLPATDDRQRGRGHDGCRLCGLQLVSVAVEATETMMVANFTDFLV